MNWGLGWIFTYSQPPEFYFLDRRVYTVPFKQKAKYETSHKGIYKGVNQLTPIWIIVDVKHRK